MKGRDWIYLFDFAEVSRVSGGLRELEPVLGAEQLVHQEVALLKGQLLTILAHHHWLVLVEGVWRELEEVFVRIMHKFCLPLDGKVGVVLDRRLVATEDVWFQFGVGSPQHSCKSL